ncbi:unnamed protein product [Vitrella brassicaformis CCMP3155]|uniref:Uncharacterized protein n=1 Tax=Vitrella brassicaformis (strain CCMP3155) TaxID=1169540 RepID=A0A0G4GY27_VITBC|nr:unnamed protein product [Vitrella brassicaformis CCMP3155]|eukprot:CEM36005.1 unnamed protein product [Vitrella brassicaformis CCMP3155]
MFDPVSFPQSMVIPVLLFSSLGTTLPAALLSLVDVKLSLIGGGIIGTFAALIATRFLLRLSEDPPSSSEGPFNNDEGSDDGSIHSDSLSEGGYNHQLEDSLPTPNFPELDTEQLTAQWPFALAMSSPSTDETPLGSDYIGSFAPNECLPVQRALWVLRGCVACDQSNCHHSKSCANTQASRSRASSESAISVASLFEVKVAADSGESRCVAPLSLARPTSMTYPGPSIWQSTVAADGMKQGAGLRRDTRNVRLQTPVFPDEEQGSLEKRLREWHRKDAMRQAYGSRMPIILSDEEAERALGTAELLGVDQRSFKQTHKLQRNRMQLCVGALAAALCVFGVTPHLLPAPESEAMLLEVSLGSFGKLSLSESLAIKVDDIFGVSEARWDFPTLSLPFIFPFTLLAVAILVITRTSPMVPLKDLYRMLQGPAAAVVFSVVFAQLFNSSCWEASSPAEIIAIAIARRLEGIALRELLVGWLLFCCGLLTGLSTGSVLTSNLALSEFAFTIATHLGLDASPPITMVVVGGALGQGFSCENLLASDKNINTAAAQSSEADTLLSWSFFKEHYFILLGSYIVLTCCVGVPIVVWAF